MGENRKKRVYRQETYDLVYREQWERYYGLLMLYRKINGHCRVNTKRSALGRWCRRQRQRYRDGKLLPYQQEKLEELEFEFAPTGRRGPGNPMPEILPTEAMLEERELAAHRAETGVVSQHAYD